MRFNNYTKINFNLKNEMRQNQINENKCKVRELK